MSPIKSMPIFLTLLAALAAFSITASAQFYAIDYDSSRMDKNIYIDDVGGTVDGGLLVWVVSNEWSSQRATILAFLDGNTSGRVYSIETYISPNRRESYEIPVKSWTGAHISLVSGYVANEYENQSVPREY